MDPEQRSDTDRTQPNGDRTADHLTVAEAAARLGISTDAVRMRVRRGTLPSVEVDGKRMVLVERSDTDQTRPNGDQTPDQTSTEQPPEQGPSRSDTAELVEQLRSEVAYLRQLLDAEIEARRRADHLVAGMIEERRVLTAQIAQLQANAGDVAREQETEHRPNTDQTDDAKSAYAPESVQNGPGTPDPPVMTDKTLHGAIAEPVPAQVSLATGWRRWWRKILGHEG
jgi:excisionase family DNA binding protein